MQPTAEINNFISRIAALPAGPGVSLDAALQPSLDEETELRKLFATDRHNTVLANPHVGLVDVFDAPDSIRTTRARVVQGKGDLSAKHVMPLSLENRRKEGTPSMVADLEEFKKNWAIFTEGSLSQLVDWNNVVAAGGSVLACLTPLEEENKISKRAIRKHYHSNAYPTSDVDLFLWGMTPEQAEVKIKAIYEAVRDSVPWDVTCIRTKHTVSIHSQYPYRSVQIVLRLYQSPAEILAGFDVDAPCCAYDGNRVWANPRAVIAMMRQCNTVDMTRRSPSYEIRLSKYSQRGFEAYVPTLQRDNIDPTIFERSIARMEGLARLLVLEKLTDDNMRTAFLEGRRTLRGRPNVNKYNRYNKRKYKGDLKVESGIGIEMNDYDVASLHIPYGPGWDARRIDKLVYQTDLGMNSTFNPKNKGRRLHRHPAFFGTVEECLEDCCEHCPKAIDDDEKKLQEEEEEMYIRGRIKFVEENPGRQSISGSFNPIDVGEWSEQVYIKPTQQLFSAIASHDRVAVQKVLQEGTIDLNQRDHVGRTTLHVAIFARAVDIACDLIDAGARISARLADGRAPLHLAAQYDLASVIKKLLEKSKKNVEEAETKKKADKDGDEKMEDANAPERPSSEDDWSSDEDEDIEMSDADDEDEEDEEDEDSDDETGNKQKKPEEKPAETGEIPEEEEDQPDIIEIDAFDWDLGFSAFSYAVLFGSLATLEALIVGEADPKLATNPSQGHLPFHPLTLTILRDNQDEACKIAERLLQIPSVTSSTANQNMVTILHAAVSSGRTKLVETILRCDKNASSVINFPSIEWGAVIFPVVTAIHKKHYAILGTMLAHGAKLNLDEEDITRALEAAAPDLRQRVTGYGSVKNYLHIAYQPLEVAIRNQDDVANLLLALGAPADLGLRRSLAAYSNISERRTLKDWVDFAVLSITHLIEDWESNDVVLVSTAMDIDSAKLEEEAKTGWRGFYEGYVTSLKKPGDKKVDQKKAEEKRLEQAARSKKEELERLGDVKRFLLELRSHLEKRGAKTWKEAYPLVETTATLPVKHTIAKFEKQVIGAKKQRDTNYVYLGTSSYNRQNVPEHLIDHYDELFEACFAGDHDKIQRLCLPVEGQGATIAKNTPPLNISVRMVDGSISIYDSRGYTPLFAAISARRWATAKFILAVATAQYHPPDEEDKIKFDIDVDMDDDSDNDSCASDDSDQTIERPEFKFIDIASRPSAVQSNIHPKTMLQLVPVTVRNPTNVGSGSSIPLVKAIADHDLEAFVQIANLYQSLPQPLELEEGTLGAIMTHDQPDILDEYIRRTGSGVNIEGARKQAGMKEGEGELPVITNDENKLYLGLNVHGKKRMDLARKNDPNAMNNAEVEVLPLVWRAASLGAKDIINYLATDRPFTAYKFYATTHSDPKAIWFRRLLGKKDAKKTENDLEAQLPAWLGWCINSLGESPLAAAIIGNKVEIVKLIAKLEPALVAQALQTKIKFVGVNPIMLGLSMSSVKVMEYLLERKVSAIERDSSRGWNIYHYICDKYNYELLQFFFEKLPRDTSEMLLAQQSNGRLNTPLHLAVKRGRKELVEIILSFTKSTSILLKRDIDGQTPLHCAAKAGYSDITRQLLAASPPEALHMENSVGNTPLEIVNLAEINERLRTYTLQNTYQFPDILPSAVEYTSHPLSSTLKKVEVELMEIREGVESLFKDGTGKVNTNIKTATVKWAEEMGKKVEVYKERQKVKEEEERQRKLKDEEATPTSTALVLPMTTLPPSAHTCDFRKTSSLIQEALASRSDSLVPATRHLIHLFDVQQSVNATLAKVGGKEDEGEDYSYNRYRYRRRNRNRGDEGELEDEEDEDKKARRLSMVFQYLSIGADTM